MFVKSEKEFLLVQSDSWVIESLVIDVTNLCVCVRVKLIWFLILTCVYVFVLIGALACILLVFLRGLKKNKQTTSNTFKKYKTIPVVCLNSFQDFCK